MGGMQTWIWAHKYPDMMDIAVPMALMLTEMSSRNWMMRRLIVDSIRNDPERDERELHEAAAQLAIRFRVLCNGDQRRQPSHVSHRADA